MSSTRLVEVVPSPSFERQNAQSLSVSLGDNEFASLIEVFSAFFQNNSNFTIHVTKPPDDQWRVIKEEDGEVAEYAELYSDDTPAGKELAQHFYQSKQASSDPLSRLHRHTANLINGLKRLDQRQRETQAFINLQNRFNMRTMEYHNLNVEAHLNESGDDKIRLAIRAIGTMLRSLLFVSFQGCYYLGALLPKDGGSGAHTKLADALNEERFYAWMEAFQRTFNVPEEDEVYADLKDPEEYCDIENQSGTYLRSTWARDVVRRLSSHCRERGVGIREEMTTLILATPYVFITRIVIAQRISSALDSLAKALATAVPKNKTLVKGFPPEFDQCFKAWRTERGWNIDGFSLAFSSYFENIQHAKEIFRTLIFLMHRYDLTALILELLTRPHLLCRCFDTSILHRRQLTGAADETNLKKLKESIEVGGHVANDEHLSKLAKGGSSVLGFLEEGVRLAEVIYPGRISGFPFKDVGDLVATYEDASSVVAEGKDIFEDCEMRFATDRELLREYLPQDLCKGPSMKRSGEYNDGGNPFHPAKFPRTH